MNSSLPLPLVLAGLVSIACVGCTESSTPAAGAAETINTHCPVMGGKVDSQTTVDWNGKKVGFCCPPCIDEWKEMTEAEREEALKEAASGKGHEEHGDHDADEPEHDDGAESGSGTGDTGGTDDAPLEIAPSATPGGDEVE